MSKEAMKQALDFIERTSTYLPTTFDAEGMSIHTALRITIEQAEKQEPVTLNRAGVQKLLEQSGYDNANPEEMAAFISGIRHREAEMLDTPPGGRQSEDCLTAAPNVATPRVQEPVKLRRGDVLRCIETDELCTVWATSTTGKTLIKWSANNFGDYTAEQIGELFWLEPAQQEPVGMIEGQMYEDGTRASNVIHWASRNAENDFPVGTLLYTSPPAQRKPLTDDELIECERLAGIRHRKHMGSIRGQQISPADQFLWHYARAIEAAHGIKE